MTLEKSISVGGMMLRIHSSQRGESKRTLLHLNCETNTFQAFTARSHFSLDKFPRALRYDLERNSHLLGERRLQNQNRKPSAIQVLSRISL